MEILTLVQVASLNQHKVGNVPNMIDISKALLTPIIAIVTVYIAYQQWKTNELKLKLEKYDRRLRVYEEVIKILRDLELKILRTDEHGDIEIEIDSKGKFSVQNLSH